MFYSNVIDDFIYVPSFNGRTRIQQFLSIRKNKFIHYINNSLILYFYSFLSIIFALGNIFYGNIMGSTDKS